MSVVVDFPMHWTWQQDDADTKARQQHKKLVEQAADEFIRMVKHFDALVVQRPAHYYDHWDETSPITTEFVAIAPGIILKMSGLLADAPIVGRLSKATKPILAVSDEGFDDDATIHEHMLLTVETSEDAAGLPHKLSFLAEQMLERNERNPARKKVAKRKATKKAAR